jgi:hypothetical protein
MNWLRRLRGAIGMGVTWAIGGALVGGVMEFIANFVPGLNVVDMWIPLFAMPGAVCGAVFSLVLGIAARSRKFEELSPAQFGVWGAVGGLIVSTAGLAAGLGGAVVSGTGLAIIVGAPALFSAVMASGIMAIARRGAGRSLNAGAAAELTEGDAP